MNFCMSQTQLSIWSVMVGTSHYLLNQMPLGQPGSFLTTSISPEAFEDTEPSIFTDQRQNAAWHFQENGLSCCPKDVFIYY